MECGMLTVNCLSFILPLTTLGAVGTRGGGENPVEHNKHDTSSSVTFYLGSDACSDKC